MIRVPSKHSGLEKAVFQIEQALRRSHAGSIDQVQTVEQATELRFLLERSRELLNSERGLPGHISAHNGNGADHEQSSVSPQQTSTSMGTSPSRTCSRDDSAVQPKVEEDQLSLDDAENPLQLLARTSELLSSITPQAQGSGATRLPSKSTSSRGTAAEGDDLQRFFGRFQPRLDLGEDLDPIEQGIVSLTEAEALFSYFHEKLAHTRWGIDPVIHTVDFVRGRSAFLLTSICAASALFSPSMESLYKRLSNHRQNLANLIMARRHKSVEIVLAFMANIPWISAGEHWADDETSTYLSMALTIALDLSLNKIILPPPTEPRSPREAIAISDCISARKALAIDGFADANLISNVRAICDGYVNGSSESSIVDRVKSEITLFFDRWYQTWPLQLGDREQHSLPPYVEILASHTRLSMYSSVINHGTAPVGARHFFRAAGLSSALNVLRVAVQGEGQLRSMPNNTAIMISFAACFALRVSTVADGRGSSLAPSIRALIAETTDVLERIGSSPIQRKGLSCLFAGQLRQILKYASRPLETAQTLPEPNGDVPKIATIFTDMNAAHMASHQGTIQMPIPATSLPPDYLLFSTMSDENQLDEAINNTDIGLNAFWEDFQFQSADLDWMDWSTSGP
ncbi:hypothetical protein AAE478_001362 [Parahypoxylon ruwenzoriense]